jgi:biotin transport system substrate-specific component
MTSAIRLLYDFSLGRTHEAGMAARPLSNEAIVMSAVISTSSLRVLNAHRWLRDILVVLGGTVALALAAQIAGPGSPVPITMQSLVVLALGVTAGPRLGTVTVLAYLAEGAAGLPVFAHMGGALTHLTGPTGGYLLSFLPAVWVTGHLARTGWGQRTSGMLLNYLLGHGIILALGAAYLAMFTGIGRAVALGVVPFLVGSVVKSALGTAIGLALRNRLRR